MTKIKSVRFYDESGNELNSFQEIREKATTFKGKILDASISREIEFVNFEDQQIKVGNKWYHFITQEPSLIAKSITNAKFGNTDSSIMISPNIEWAARELERGHSVSLKADYNGKTISDTVDKIQGNVLIGSALTYKVTE
ncbi:MAG: hypothetical protein IKF52_01515 [Clostridia bacterium]|nr:hypothetical protein [Clostridia bacterium]MBR3152178.1 hypothetical protein [Clostridia bacterium]MBR3152285.1 hypothetical protein [Clostridia bacterium]